MIFKLIFTILAILWLYQAMRPYFRVQSPPVQPPKPEPPPTALPPGTETKKNTDYIDFEEVKED